VQGNGAHHDEDVPDLLGFDKLSGALPPADSLEGLAAFESDDLRARAQDDIGTLLDPTDQVARHRLRQAARPDEDVHTRG